MRVPGPSSGGAWSKLSKPAVERTYGAPPALSSCTLSTCSGAVSIGEPSPPPPSCAGAAGVRPPHVPPPNVDSDEAGRWRERLARGRSVPSGSCSEPAGTPPSARASWEVGVEEGRWGGEVGGGWRLPGGTRAWSRGPGPGPGPGYLRGRPGEIRHFGHYRAKLAARRQSQQGDLARHVCNAVIGEQRVPSGVEWVENVSSQSAGSRPRP